MDKLPFPMKHVNRVKGKDGKIRHYHRKTKERIPDEIMKDTVKYIVWMAEREGVKPIRSVIGTLGRLVEEYRLSPEFAALSASSRQDYADCFDWLKSKGHDETALRKIDTAWGVTVRNAALAERRFTFANRLRDVLRLVWNWGRERGKAPAANPFRDVPRVPRPKGMPAANRPWTPEEIDVVLAAAKGGLRTGIFIAVHSALRECDVIRLPWTVYDGQAFRLWQKKTGREVWIPVTAELRAELERTPKVSPIIVTNQWKHPYSQKGFQGAFRTLIRDLEEIGAVRPGLTFHGLRHTVANELAEADATVEQIQHVLGQRSKRMAEHYARRASRKRSAAAGIALLERSRNGKLQND